MSDFRTKFSLPSRYQLREKNLWVEYFELARKYKPVDLGIGSPDFLPPDFVKDALVEVASTTNNEIHQYTRGAGHPRLVFAISKLHSTLIGREIDPYSEIVATLGGYHALFLAIMATVDTGDEVIIMEPFFECFEHNVRTAGGIPRFIPLKPKENTKGTTTTDDWVLDREHLESLFNAKTKVIIVNTPHNPLGKVFSHEELSHIAQLCKKWNVVCISDEVYQFLVYGSKKHISMASLPEMWDRTITVCTAGKIFGTTGWKLGWAYGPSHLISNLQMIHFSCVRAGNTFLQEVGAICIEKQLACFGSEDSFLVSSAAKFEKKRDFVFEVLEMAGLKPVKPDGGYFIVANWSPLEKRIDLSSEQDEFKDYRFTKWMTKNVGVQGIPVSPFYCKEHKHMGENFVRYCFVKTDAYLEKAAQAFRDWKLKSN